MATTITRRIAHQVVSGEFEPKNILAVTFTTKAAGELEERLARLGASGVPAKTSHAAALSQLTVRGGRDYGVLPSKILWGSQTQAASYSWMSPPRRSCRSM